LNYKQAQSQLRYALRNQKTITTNKLSRILQTMNISLHKDNTDKEIKFLKAQIKNKDRRIQVISQQLHERKIRHQKLRERIEKCECK